MQKKQTTGKENEPHRRKTAENGYLHALFSQKHISKSKNLSINAAHVQKKLMQKSCSTYPGRGFWVNFCMKCGECGEFF